MADKSDNFPHQTRDEFRGSPGPLADLVYRELHQEIVGGTFAERDRLPTEADIALRFSVSRPVVREALARLRDEGLIVSRRGAGSFVTGSAGTTRGAYAPASSISDIEACFEFRICIESRSVAMAAANATPEHLEAIRERVTRLQRHLSEHRQDSAEPDIQFHLAIAEAAGNRFFRETMQSLRSSIAFSMQLTGSLAHEARRARQQIAADEHVAIYHAIASGDATAAERLMIQHLENARARLFNGSSP